MFSKTGSISPSNLFCGHVLQNALIDFCSEDAVLEVNVKKLSMSDECGVDVLPTLACQYSTDEKCKVKKSNNFSPGSE
jgi:P2-related tail formation protein